MIINDANKPNTTSWIRSPHSPKNICDNLLEKNTKRKIEIGITYNKNAQFRDQSDILCMTS